MMAKKGPLLFLFFVFASEYYYKSKIGELKLIRVLLRFIINHLIYCINLANTSGVVSMNNLRRNEKERKKKNLEWRQKIIQIIAFL